MNRLIRIILFTAYLEFAIRDLILWLTKLLRKLIRKLFTFPYLTIDSLPAWNYAMILKESDTRYISRFYNIFKNYKFDKEMQVISNQLIDTYGFSEYFKYYMQKEKSRNVMFCKYMSDVKNNKHLETKLKIKSLELKEIKQTESQNLFSIKPSLDKYMSYEINMKKISTRAYLDKADSYNKHTKANG